ncbi:MAG: HlyD family efflux transporter periplasmic adaptor subunit [Planctomycetota bacterium]|jgi:multidrug efflux pump subunit AcrA (membrane-fusion protein)
MKRFQFALGLCFVALLLAAVDRPAETAEPKSKPAAAKPGPAKKKEPAAAKPEPAEAKPKALAVESKPKVEPKTSAAKPATHTVEAGPLKIEISLDGVFVPQRMSEVSLRPESWTTFKVVEAVEHGQTVGRGDVLVRFDSKTIDRAVADGRTARRLSDLSFEQAEISLKILEQSTPMSIASAERSRQHADEDLARYREVGRRVRIRSAEESLKSAENALEYQMEELRQLEKMYEADDLTEETEEIILKRQRDTVERYKYYLEQARLSHEETLEFSVPRQDESIEHLTRSMVLSTEKTLATLPLELRRQEIELEKMKVQRTRDEEKLDKLLADQALMTVKSPAEGVVYYGKWSRGKWSGGATLAEKLRPGSSASANSVLMTIVSPRPLQVRVTVPEKDLHWIRRGSSGTIHPVAYPDVQAPASVSSINTTPAADGKFAAVLRVHLDDGAEGVMPGMNCKVKLVPYSKQRTLTVPVSAVKADDGRAHYVYLVDENGKSKKQPVTVGKKTEDKIEILDGVVAGDKVLKEAPKD